MPPTRIVIEVRGGLVEQVYSSDAEMHVTLIDWDCTADDSPWVVYVITEPRPKPVHVVELPVRPLAELAGSDLEQALEAAEEGATRC